MVTREMTRPPPWQTGGEGGGQGEEGGEVVEGGERAELSGSADQFIKISVPLNPLSSVVYNCTFTS